MPESSAESLNGATNAYSIPFFRDVQNVASLGNWSDSCQRALVPHNSDPVSELCVLMAHQVLACESAVNALHAEFGKLREELRQADRRHEEHVAGRTDSGVVVLSVIAPSIS